MGKLTLTTFLTLDGVMQAPGVNVGEEERGFDRRGWAHFDDEAGAGDEVHPDVAWAKLRALVDGALAGTVGFAREPRAKSRHKASVFGMYVAPEFRRLRRPGA